MYPVEVRWRPLTNAGILDGDEQTNRGNEENSNRRFGKPSQEDVGDEADPQRAILDALDELAAEDLWDILIFQPTEWDIHETAKLIRGHMARRGWTKDIELLPLYARTRHGGRCDHGGGCDGACLEEMPLPGVGISHPLTTTGPR